MPKLVRVDDKTYSQLQRVAGKIQLGCGRRTSLCEAIKRLLAGGKLGLPAEEKAVKPAVKPKVRAKKSAKKKKRKSERELVPYYHRREIH